MRWVGKGLCLFGLPQRVGAACWRAACLQVHGGGLQGAVAAAVCAACIRCTLRRGAFGFRGGDGGGGDGGGRSWQGLKRHAALRGAALLLCAEQRRGALRSAAPLAAAAAAAARTAALTPRLESQYRRWMHLNALHHASPPLIIKREAIVPGRFRTGPFCPAPYISSDLAVVRAPHLGKLVKNRRVCCCVACAMHGCCCCCREGAETSRGCRDAYAAPRRCCRCPDPEARCCCC